MNNNNNNNEIRFWDESDSEASSLGDIYDLSEEKSAKQYRQSVLSESLHIMTAEQLSDKTALKSEVPKFRVNLDLKAEDRWKEIATVFKNEILAVDKIITDLLGQLLGETWGSLISSCFGGFMSTLSTFGVVYYDKELAGIAKALGEGRVQLGKLVAMQLVYEASACCTSIVIPSDPSVLGGAPVHIRTMDWGMDFLRPLTIEVEFCKNNRPLFTATTWAGYVGVLTGLKPDTFSASVNFRLTNTGSYWKNLKSALNGHWPIGFLLREALVRSTSFDEAVSVLSSSPLISPVYFTVCGMKPDEGAIITRNQNSEENRQVFDKDHPVLIQTNIDHWSSDPNEDIMDSILRRAFAKQRLEAHVSSSNVNSNFLFSVMSMPPIFNSLTIYSTLMQPASGLYRTRIPNKYSGFVRQGSLPDDPEHEKKKRMDEVNELTKLRRCANCWSLFSNEKNEPAKCAHNGEWHSTFEQCNYLKCGLGLKTKIGQCHWSCCYETNYQKPCGKSDKHVEVANASELRKSVLGDEDLPTMMKGE